MSAEKIGISAQIKMLEREVDFLESVRGSRIDNAEEQLTEALCRIEELKRAERAIEGDGVCERCESKYRAIDYLPYLDAFVCTHCGLMHLIEEVAA